MLTKADHDAIAQAVRQAEIGTSGEILCVLARRVSNYRETPLAWGAGAALLLPPIVLALGARFGPFAPSGWDAGAGGAGAIVRALSAYALGQIVVFALTALIIAAVRPIKLALTPGLLKHRRVRQAAMSQLMATRLLGSQIGAAVVIFASLEDRMVAVVADEAIHLKVGDQAWDKAVATVLDGVRRGAPAAGFIDAVNLCGGLLAEHFPPEAAAHHLADGVLEL
jgi:putative membrane protein